MQAFSRNRDFPAMLRNTLCSKKYQTRTAQTSPETLERTGFIPPSHVSCIRSSLRNATPPNIKPSSVSDANNPGRISIGCGSGLTIQPASCQRDCELLTRVSHPSPQNQMLEVFP